MICSTVYDLQILINLEKTPIFHPALSWWGKTFICRVREEGGGDSQQAPFPRNRWHPVYICNHRHHFPCIIILHTFQPNIAFTLTGRSKMMQSCPSHGKWRGCDINQILSLWIMSGLTFNSSIIKWIVHLICKTKTLDISS